MLCKHCGENFDHLSPVKVKIGGYINECPECVEESGGDKSPPKYLGVTAGDGKMSGVTILKFSTEEDRKAYAKNWRNNSGQNKGKSCQLGKHLSSTGGLKFQTVQATEAVNHKGKL